MSTLPNVPPVPDADRVTFVVTDAPVTVVPVPFPVYGVAEDLTVIVNYQPFPSNSWVFVSASGASLSVLPLPITDGQIVFNTAVSGTIEIIGSWQPRQVIQPSAPGIARREFNQVVSMIISGMRELRRLVATALQFIQTTPEGDGYYDAKGHRISNLGDALLSQDAVNLETLAVFLSGYIASGAMSLLVSWQFTGDGSTRTFPLATAGTLPNNSLSYIVSINNLLIDPPAYTIDQTAKTITFASPPVNTSDIFVRVFLATLTAPTTTQASRARQASNTGTDTATLSDGIIYWATPFAGAKTQHIPAANTAAQNAQLTIADGLGDAAVHPILITPASGTINNFGSAIINSNHGSVTLAAVPFTDNWIIV